MAKHEARYVGSYLVRGDAGGLEALLTKLEKEKVIARGSPDLFAKAYRAFGIDDAAEIRLRARTKPVAGLQRVFIIATPGMTREAQNALLKTLEEPAADAVFFLLVPAPEMLLSTIRSRSQFLEIDAAALESIVDVDDFLAAPAAKRIEMLKPLYDTEDDGRDMGGVIAFLAGLERAFAKGKLTEEKAEGVRAIYRAQKYAGDKGSLLKSLLEQVALLSSKV